MVKVSSLIRVLLTVLVVMLCVCFHTVLVGEAYEERSPRIEGSREGIIFPVISDIHMKDSGTEDMHKLERALKMLSTFAPVQDAFVVVGDVTDSGHSKQYNRFTRTYGAYRQQQVVSLFAIGNHDYWNGLSVEGAQVRFKERMGVAEIYYHKVIKGYHFIVLGSERGDTHGFYSLKQIEWLKGRLQEAIKSGERKPIFVFIHHPIQGTVYGSDGWGVRENKDELYGVLKMYPQAIVFSGHSHFPLNDPRSIHQKDFTSVGLSSVSYMEVEGGSMQGNKPTGYTDISQGVIVEAKENVVKIKRMDFHSGTIIREPWTINIPTFNYGEKRDQLAPFFKESAIIIPRRIHRKSIEVIFDQAVDNEGVHSYEVVLREKETGQVVTTLTLLSEFYKIPMPLSLPLTIKKLSPRTTYTLQIQAVDSFGNKSERKLECDIRTKR